MLVKQHEKTKTEWTPDPFAAQLLTLLKDGVPIKHDHFVRDAFLRLQRHGRVRNHGTRVNPIWKLTHNH